MTALTISGNASGGGAFRVQAPASASSQTLTFPDTTGTLYVPGTTVSVIQSGTAVASTSGTSIDFTSIPSWVKRITVMFAGVSTNGTSGIIIQLGDSGGIENTGYISTSIQVAAASSGVSYTAGFGIIDGLAANSYSGQAIISLQDSTTNTWTYSSSMTSGATTLQLGGGGKALSSTLTQLSVTTVGGANTFDLGSINILYE